jgi:hypothetical protein
MPPLRRARALLALAAAVSGILLSLLVAPPATAMQPDPAHDYYEIPQGCAGPARAEKQRPNGCRLTAWRPNRPTVVLWGDSHAWQHIPALLKAAAAEDVNLTAFVMGKCPPAKMRIQRSYPGKCEHSNALALKYVRDTARRNQPVQVLLGSHWAGYRAAIAEVEETGEAPEGYDDFDLRMLKLFRDHTPQLFPALLKTRAQLATIGQTATCERGTEPPYQCTLPRSQAILHEGATRRWLAGLSHQAPQIDVNQGICTATRCRGRIKGIYTWWDWGHLSKTRDYRLAQYFRPLLRDLRK